MKPAEQQSHRSIGEVLSLLQEEFPDVTISKIRFLESQGLVAPERTASGFRKFYDGDIQRLRWILRKQSDHFLPLKVIKKMLDDGADTSTIDDIEPQQTLWPLEDGTETDKPGAISAIAAASGDSDTQPVRDTDHGAQGSGSQRSGDELVTGSATSYPNGSLADGGPERHADVGAADGGSHPSGIRPPDGKQSGSARDTAAGRTRRPSPTHPSIVGRRIIQEASESVGDHGRSNGNGIVGGRPDEPAATPKGADLTGRTGDDMADTERSKGIMTPADIVAALQEDPRPGGSGRGTRGGEPEDDPGTTHRADSNRVRQFSVEDLTDTRGRGDFLSAEEICEMFDIEQALLDDLEKFGLIAPRRYGGTTSFDGSDVEIIGVAVRYATMGVEPRHLRMYKIAAEREAGFVEQLVVPILKQRNPTAKQNAAERCSQLASMGDELHNLILRRHLRNLLDNR